MRDCLKLREYLNEELGGWEKSRFEGHIKLCAECGASVENKTRLDSDIKAYFDSLEIPDVTDAKADRLVREAALPAEDKGSFSIRFFATMTAVTAVAAAIAIVVLRQSPEIADSKTSDAGKFQIVYSHLATLEEQHSGKLLAAVEPKGDLRANISQDRFRLHEKSRAVISQKEGEETHFDLKSGKITIEAAKRGTGESLRVSAGDYEVRVVGTAFSVAISRENEVSVGVTEGTVQVSGGNEPPSYVKAGEELLLGPKDADNLEWPKKAAAIAELPEAPDPEEPMAGSPRHTVQFDRTKVLNLINDGRFAEALEITNKYLASHPKDFQAWTVLADYSVQMNDWESAKDAYEKAIKYGDARNANRTRFKAAAAAHDKFNNPGRAVELLQDYLNAPNAAKPLEPEALLRLAKAQIALKRNASAIKTLDRLLGSHKGTSAAVEGRKLRHNIVD